MSVVSRTLLTQASDANLDLDAWIGQRTATFRFDLVDGITGERLGEIHPIYGATLTHDTSRTIKRQLNLNLGATDTASVNTLTDRVLVTMVFANGVEYPLGRYMFTDDSRQVFTSGKLSSQALNDEMFLVDQQISTGIDGVHKNVSSVIQEVLAELPIIEAEIEATDFNSAEAWGIGTGRGQMLESLAVSGDYFSPWFGNDGKFHMIRTFDPATKVPAFDFDAGNQVMRSGIVETDELLTAPNRIIVISNSADAFDNPIFATADIPVTAPNSIANRGFVLANTLNLPLSSQSQAQAVAIGLAQRSTVFEKVNLSTAPDPRHDSYDVIRWQGELWLELAWGLGLVEGAPMSHTLRKAYSA